MKPNTKLRQICPLNASPNIMILLSCKSEYNDFTVNLIFGLNTESFIDVNYNPSSQLCSLF